MHKFSVKFWQNRNEELLKVGCPVNFSQYSGNVAKAIIGPCNKTIFEKVSKTLAEFDKVLNFEKFLIYVVTKSN